MSLDKAAQAMKEYDETKGGGMDYLDLLLAADAELEAHFREVMAQRLEAKAESMAKMPAIAKNAFLVAARFLRESDR